jgi:hypothetical protein
MHDDDEQRFPRISLRELLRGIFRPVLSFLLWGPVVLFERGPDKASDRRTKGPTGEPDKGAS